MSRVRTLAMRIPAHLAALALLVSALIVAQPADAQPPRWGDIVGPPTATSFGVYLPTTPAQVATLTEDDRARIYAAAAIQVPKVRALIDAGVITPEVKIGYARPRNPTTAGGRLMSPLTSHMFSDARCAIAWQGYPFSGTTVYAWGQTVSNTTARDYLYGTLYQNGAWIDRFPADLTGTVAYSRTNDWWVAWWDHPTFVANSEHGIQYAGTNTYDWGPWYCSVTKTI